MRGYASKVDRNQSEIVAVLRQLGFSVLSLHRVGEGAPDLVAGKHEKNFLIEVKDGTKPPSHRKLNPDQVKFHEEWRGQICVLTSVDDVLAFSKTAGEL